MRTRYRQYKITMHLASPIPVMAEDGTMTIKCSAKTIQSAERYAWQNAQILMRHRDIAPVRCVIEYNTTAGKQVKEITVGKEDKVP